MDWKISRREFLKFTGFTIAGLTLGDLLKDKVLKKEVFKEGWSDGPGIESFPLSICRRCPAGCSVKIRLVDGDAKKVFGNPLCPVSRGKLCPKGEASLETLYDPNRWLGPARREGRGKEQALWRKITWEDGLSELIERLQKLREKGEPQRLVWIMEEDPSSYGPLVRRFMKAYGSPNLVTLADHRDPALREVLKACQGIYEDPAYDFEKCGYILSFGTPLLESWLSPVWIHRSFGYFRQGRPQGRGRFVQIEPRLSPTAAKADEWIPIRPGTEAHLALAIAHILIREERYDQNFVKEQCEGFESWRDFVLSNCEPDHASELTGIPVTKILQLAREFSGPGPAIAVAERPVLSNGFFTLWAVHCLNALMGRIDRPGGILFQRPLPTKELPQPKLDSIAERGLLHGRYDGLSSDPPQASALARLAEGILNGSEAPEILILSNSRFLTHSPETQLFLKAVERIPFVVSFSSFSDDASAIADLVLPDHTFFEKWQDHRTPSWNGTPRYAISSPALPPLLNTRHQGEVLFKIAQGLGGNLSASFPWQDYPGFLREMAQGLYESRRGTFFTTVYESSWIRQMETGGWWISQAKNFEEFWTKLIQSGGWHDPVYSYDEWRRVLRTPSRKFIFFGAPKEMHVSEIPKRDAAYPFYLYPFGVLALGGVEDPNQPFLQEILSTLVDGAWINWAEINPETAKKLGIRDGDPIWIESSRGKVKLIARLFPGTAPDVVCVLLGNSHREDNLGVQNLLVYKSDLGKAYPKAFTTKVNIYKA